MHTSSVQSACQRSVCRKQCIAAHVKRHALLQPARRLRLLHSETFENKATGADASLPSTAHKAVDEASFPTTPAAPAAPAASTDNVITDATVATAVLDEPTVTASGATEIKSFPIQLDASDLFGTKELWEEGQFGRRGEMWLLAQISVLVLVLLPPIPLTGLVDFLGTLAITAGIVFILYGILSLGRSFFFLPHPRRNHQLVTSGMFGYVRHPVYSGLLMTCFGLAAITRNECRLALASLLWWILEQAITFEERALSEKYPEYERYKQRVKKFLPYVY